MKEKFEKFRKSEVVRKLSSYFAKKEEILLAYLFGSVAEEKQTKLSDLDVAVLVESNRLQELDQEPFGYQAAITTDLMALLRTNDVDVVILNHATPLLAYEVVKYGIKVFCRDDDERIRFEVHIFQQYVDTKPLREIQHYYLTERIKNGTLTREL